jgi:hypothetical protein
MFTGKSARAQICGLSKARRSWLMPLWFPHLVTSWCIECLCSLVTRLSRVLMYLLIFHVFVADGLFAEHVLGGMLAIEHAVGFSSDLVCCLRIG